MKLDPLEGTDDISFIKLSLIEKKCQICKSDQESGDTKNLKLSDTKGGIFLNDPILDCLEWCDVDDVPSSTYK
ncbi:hypothetical protein RIR_jg16087.t1 [Rhizophagus irregularis DAOM 181602=DAOM 197198]|nr:hypothetical protein RIR_jg16087.t1 [Rhizophagus irregularis DAOM 181602=DAOM 197198]CAG8678552.1 22653_t:CDS:2 [Rhizophagus irregularis]